MNEASTFASATGGQTRAAPTHEQIARRAQQLWESYGRPENRDDEIWFAAENELNSPPPAASDGATPPPSSRTGRAPAPGTEVLSRGQASSRASQANSRRAGKPSGR